MNLAVRIGAGCLRSSSVELTFRNVAVGSTGFQAVTMTQASRQDASPADPAAPPQAQLLEHLRVATTGEYEILGELGRGGMATVFLAHEIALERKVGSGRSGWT